MTAAAIPEYRDWSVAAVKLLQGVVYIDDAEAWRLTTANKTRLEEYFARIGLALVVDEEEGFAYLRQLEDHEAAEGYDELPKLFRKSRLSYDTTLLCVMLRDELRRFEETELENQRCVVATNGLFEMWTTFFDHEADEVRLMKSLRSALSDLEDLKFVRKFANDPEEWEIRRILKARMPIASLSSLLAQLQAAHDSREKNGDQ